VSRLNQFAMCFVLTVSAVVSGAAWAPEACALGLTFGFVLLVFQVEGYAFLRVGAALSRF
jgi:hypothetical protein